jgi:hypothetical protein
VEAGLTLHHEALPTSSSSSQVPVPIANVVRGSSSAKPRELIEIS